MKEIPTDTMYNIILSNWSSFKLTLLNSKKRQPSESDFNHLTSIGEIRVHLPADTHWLTGANHNSINMNSTIHDCLPQGLITHYKELQKIKHLKNAVQGCCDVLWPSLWAATLLWTDRVTYLYFLVYTCVIYLFPCWTLSYC